MWLLGPEVVWIGFGSVVNFLNRDESQEGLALLMKRCISAFCLILRTLVCGSIEQDTKYWLLQTKVKLQSDCFFQLAIHGFLYGSF